MGATALTAAAAGSTAATCGSAPAAGGTDEFAAAVRALPGAVVAFAAALAAGAPTRTSAQVSAHTMRFGPSISKGIGFARLSPGMATMTCFFRLR